MAELDGRLPRIYEDAFRACSPSGADRVTGTMFAELAKQTEVTRPVLRKIWALADVNKRGVLDREQFNMALAMIAMVQAGEEPEARKLSQWPEPPVPRLGSLQVVREVAVAEGSNALNFTYRELMDAEFIQVTIAKPSGGLFLKHTNYDIFSKRKNTTFTRRFSDFELFDMLLRKRYPFRIIPTLPPKQLSNKDPVFLEARRKGLQRYLAFIGRHPVLRDDDMVVFFMMDQASDFQTRIKIKFKAEEDEYDFNPMAKDALKYVPQDIVGRIAGMQKEIPPLLSAFSGLVKIADRIRARSEQAAQDFLEFDTHLKELTSVSSGYLAGHETWHTIQEALKNIGGHLKTVSERNMEQQIREDDGICHNLRQFMDLLQGLKDLFDRRARGIASDFDRISKKLAKEREQMARMAAAGSSGSETAAKLEDKIKRHDSQMDVLESKNEFSLYAIWAESKLVQVNFAQIGTLMEELAQSQMLGHRQLVGAWDSIRPLGADLVAKLESTSPFH